LLYLEKAGEKYGLGIDRGKVRNERGEWEDFTGTYAVDTPNGRVIFYYQGGRLVALAFADDVCMLAESAPQAQQLLDAAVRFSRQWKLGRTETMEKKSVRSSIRRQEWLLMMS
jgi:hypothetical protein